jgi:hypothetical protein
MRHRVIVIAAVAAVLAGTSVDLGACGDKYTRIGQSTRLKHYAAIHRASILVYKPAKASSAGVSFYKELLTHAGHKAQFVDYGEPIDKKIVADKIDVLLVHYADLPAVMSGMQSLAIKPEILPILGKESMALATQAQKDYPFLIVPERMTPVDALDQIDHVMERRLKNAAGAGQTKGG